MDFDSHLLDALTPPSDRADVEDWLIEREEEAAALFGSLAYEATRAVATAYASTLRAAGDPAALDGLSVVWSEFLAGPGSEYVAGMHLAGHLSAYLGAASAIPAHKGAEWADIANRNAADYQKAALNRMRDDTFWPDIRSRVTGKLSDGMTMPELTREIEALSGYSRSRAEAIARTESISAYNRGDIAGARALGPFGPVEKVWSSARDARTRPSHAEASGQTVPLDQPFTVGGVQMDSPGAAGAPASEVVNCRCSMLMLYPGDTRPDGTEVPEAGTVFDRNAPTGEAVDLGDGVDELERHARIVRRQAILNADEQAARDFYMTDHFTKINAPLRAGRAIDDPDLLRHVESLDAAIMKSELPGDVTLFRGLSFEDPREHLTSRLKFRPGAVLADDAYLSTTTTQQGLAQFAQQTPGARGIALTIRAKKGTRFVAGHADEGEVVLGRGQKLRVVSVDTSDRELTRVTLETV